MATSPSSYTSSQTATLIGNWLHGCQPLKRCLYRLTAHLGLSQSNITKVSRQQAKPKRRESRRARGILWSEVDKRLANTYTQWKWHPGSTDQTQKKETQRLNLLIEWSLHELHMMSRFVMKNSKPPLKELSVPRVEHRPINCLWCSLFCKRLLH